MLRKTTALAGGVGGAKLADGLAHVLRDVSVIVNTGDDFEHFGLWISPDLDTVCYKLAGIENEQTGWGRAGESWETLQEIQILGGPDWFKLGNRDLATHLERTRRLDAGEKLHEITARFCAAWGVEAQVFPMSNDPVPTMVSTQWGEIAFQRYFVELACEPVVSGFRFAGVEESRPAPGVISAIQKADLVVICPSNPWVSIDPILAVPGIRSALKDALVIAVSPIISGRAVRGPAAKMYKELGFNPSAAAVAEHYGDILDGFIIDEEDADLKEEILDQADHPLQVLITNTWMRNQKDRIRVAEDVLKFYEILTKEV